MNGQMMHYSLTTNVILEYGNRVYPAKEIVTKLPDGAVHRYTYADMYRRTRKIAGAMVNRLGVKTGDRVATFAFNHYQHLELYYAIPGVGAICHTLNIRLAVDQIIYIINHAGDEIIFVDGQLIPLLEKIVPHTPGVKRCVLMNAPANMQTSLPDPVHYEDLIGPEEESFDWPELDENQACGLCYTSGTTGNPKGALYTHRSTYLHAMAIMSPNATCISSRDIVLLIVPQFHVMAWGFPYMCMLTGATMVMPGVHLQPPAIIDLIQQEQVTVANGVPTIWMGVYQELKKNPPAAKLPLREYMVGGSALPASLIESFEKDFGLPGVHAWGMTETSPLGTVSRLQSTHNHLPYAEQVKIRALQGVEMPGVELRTVQENGTVAPRDGKTVGEFQVRGAWVINSYYQSEDNSAFTGDGWFKTGDVGTIDPNGYMQITDRAKDLIKSGGEWISSVALEVALMAHPHIQEAAVIAIPDDKWEERPLACLVLSDGANVTVSELKAFLSGDFAAYQIPDKFVLVEEIPKTSVGKFDKKKMRAMYAEGKFSLSIQDSAPAPFDNFL